MNQEFDLPPKGAIKRVQVRSVTKFVRAGVVRQYISSQVITYNSAGLETEQTNFDGEGNITYRRHSTYDAVNKLTVRRTSFVTDHLEVEENFQDGLPRCKTERNDSRNSHFESTYAYDPQSRLVYFGRFKSDGTLIDKKEISYTSSGERVEDEVFGTALPAGDTTYRIKTAAGFGVSISAFAAARLKTRYNLFGNPVTAIFYDAENAELKRYKFCYSNLAGSTNNTGESGDGNPQINSKAYLSADHQQRLMQLDEYLTAPAAQHPESGLPPLAGNVLLTLGSAYMYARAGDYAQSLKSLLDAPLESRRLYAWHESGKLAREQLYIFGQIIDETQYEYGSHGELFKKVNRNASGVIENENNVDWEFDDRANWMKMTSTEIRKAGSKHETREDTVRNRTIEYYE